MSIPHRQQRPPHLTVSVAEASGLYRAGAGTSGASRETIFARDGYACRWWGAVADIEPPHVVYRRPLGQVVRVPTRDVLTIDHARSRLMGGTNGPDNKITLCTSCNNWKGGYPWPDPPRSLPVWRVAPMIVETRRSPWRE